MRTTRIALSVATCAMVVLSAVSNAEAQRMYNTAKQKVMSGQQIVGGTVDTPDPQIYCAMANAGFDFIWIEMQHSPLSYQDVARMIWACKDAPAIPFIRVPDATEGDIQKATDIGALGIIVPMVITPEEMENAVQWAKYPPMGIRSQGGGQYRAIWGNDYRQTANDNIMIIAMIESPAGQNRLYYLVSVLSNVLRKNSAQDHRDLARAVQGRLLRDHPAKATGPGQLPASATFGEGFNGYAAERRAIQLKLDTQESLLDLGYEIGEIDGVIGRGTRKAIRSFQKSQGLKVTGQPSEALLAKMRQVAQEKGLARPGAD